MPCLFVRRLGCQHGPAEARRCRRHGDGGAVHAARHDEIGDNGCEMAICFAPVVIRVAMLLTVFSRLATGDQNACISLSFFPYPRVPVFKILSWLCIALLSSICTVI